MMMTKCDDDQLLLRHTLAYSFQKLDNLCLLRTDNLLLLREFIVRSASVASPGDHQWTVSGAILSPQGVVTYFAFPTRTNIFICRNL